MKGKITYYNEEKYWGFILGEDAEKYFFHVKNTKEPLQIEKKLFVEFEPIKGKENKLAAINVSIISIQKNEANKNSKNKITINNEVILTSSILSYQLSTREPEYTDIRIFNESGNWGYEDYCYNKHSDGYFTYGEDYWHISEYLDCIDTYIGNNFDYWSGGGVNSFNEYEYLNDLEEYNDQKRKYFINIKFKNGKSRNIFIGEYIVPYEIIWDEAYDVSESGYDGCTPAIFDKYYEIHDNIYDAEELTIRFPKLKFSETFNHENEVYQEASQIITELNQLV